MTNWQTWGCSSEHPSGNTSHQCHICSCRSPGSARSHCHHIAPYINDDKFALLFICLHESCLKKGVDLMNFSYTIVQDYIRPPDLKFGRWKWVMLHHSTTFLQIYLAIRQSSLSYDWVVFRIPPLTRRFWSSINELLSPQKHIIPWKYFFTIRSQWLFVFILNNIPL